MDKSLNCPPTAIAKGTGCNFVKGYCFVLASLAEGMMVKDLSKIMPPLGVTLFNVRELKV